MPEHEQTARVRRRPRMSPVWLIPIVSAVLVAYLAYTTFANRGPTVTLVLASADGLVVGETKVKHKAVAVGTVDDIRLADDMKSVVVKVRMVGGTRAMLTDHARFWVVRPRLSAAGLTGIETLVSGVYVEIDPGEPGGHKQFRFTALEQPPGRESDEPGHVYVLQAKRLGALAAGSPVFFRDVEVGQILSYDVGDGLGPVKLRAFVRAPFDRFVHPDTRFWNASGLSLSVGAEGMHIELASLQALLTGGIAFETSREGDREAPAPESTEFELFEDKAAAESAFYTENIPYVTYFHDSVQGLTRGSPVLLSGVQVGSVREVKLVYDRGKGGLLARVAFDLQPERVLGRGEDTAAAIPEEVRRALHDPRMRVALESSSLFTGTKDLSIVYGRKPVRGSRPQEGDAIVLESRGGGIDGLAASLSDVAARLDKVPFEQIGANANGALLDLREAAKGASASFGAGGYGQSSDFQRDLRRLMSELTDAARAYRVLADDLDRHPESLLRGRAEKQGGDR